MDKLSWYQITLNTYSLFPDYLGIIYMYIYTYIYIYAHSLNEFLGILLDNNANPLF